MVWTNDLMSNTIQSLLVEGHWCQPIARSEKPVVEVCKLQGTKGVFLSQLLGWCADVGKKQLCHRRALMYPTSTTRNEVNDFWRWESTNNTRFRNGGHENEGLRYYYTEWFSFKWHRPILQIDHPAHVDSLVDLKECGVGIVVIENLYYFEIRQCDRAFNIDYHSLWSSHGDNLLLICHSQLNRRPLQRRSPHSLPCFFWQNIHIWPKI